MNTIRFNTKKAFVEALEARRPYWQEVDAAAARNHKAAEQAWLRKTRTKLREAARLDYDGLKKAVEYNGMIGNLRTAPSCPRLNETRLDRVLKALSLTQSQAFTVDSKTGAWTDAYDLLTVDLAAKETVC